MGKLIELEKKLEANIGRLKALADGEGDVTDGEAKEMAELTDAIKSDQKTVDTLKLAEQLQTRSIKKDKVTQELDQRKQEFSLTKFIAHQFGHSSVDAGYELETSQEVAKDSGLPYEGVAVPAEVLETRAVQAGDASGGGRLLNEQQLPALQPLFAQTVASRLGVQFLRGLQQSIELPRIASIPTAGFKSETGELAEADMTFDTKLTMQPHKIGIISSYTRQMALQSAGIESYEQLLRSLLTRKVSEELDRFFIAGDSSVDADQPDGLLKSISAITRTGATNGKTVSLADLWDMTTRLANNNSPQTSRAWLGNPNIRAKLAQEETFANTGQTIYTGGGILGMPSVLDSTLMPNNLTKGTGTNLSALAYANWSSAIVGSWGSLDLLINPYRDADYKKVQTSIRLVAYVDFLFTRTSDFALLTDVITA